jgi:RNA polymerase sigma-70 factor (ECF subfamily)
MEDPDVVLMLRVQAGDEAAFVDLFRKHSPRLMQFVRRHVGNDAVAEELAQDVFVQMYKARGRYRPEARFSTWLYTIATNLCLNERRRAEHQLRVWPNRPGADERAEDVDPPDRAAATVEQEVAGRELEGRLRFALQRLPPKQRAALLLSRVDGLAYRDVGEVLGCTEGAVKALLFRATQSLKRDLQEFLGVDQQGDRDDVVPKRPTTTHPVS